MPNGVVILFVIGVLMLTGLGVLSPTWSRWLSGLAGGALLGSWLREHPFGPWSHGGRGWLIALGLGIGTTVVVFFGLWLSDF